MCHGVGLYLLVVAAQLEYYRSVIATGVYPARKIGLISTTVMYACALWSPVHHELVLPAMAAATVCWFLLMRRQVAALSVLSFAAGRQFVDGSSCFGFNSGL